MKIKILAASVMMALTAGCATQLGPKSWDIEPVVDVRHGMSEALAHYRVGRYLERHQRLDAAIAAYERAVAADGRYVPALNALGALQARTGALEASVATFRRIEALTPEFAYLHNNLGYTLLLKGDHAGAIAAFRRAVSMDPSYVRAWINLARAARAAGDEPLVAQAERRRFDPAPVVADASPMPTREGPLVLKSSYALAHVPAMPATPLDQPVLARGGAAVSDVVVPGHEATGAAVASDSAPVTATPTAPMVAPSATRITFETVEIEPLKLDRPTTSTPPQAAVPMPISGAGYRLEVSNGNGVRHFATRYGRMLKDLGQPVRRITNFDAFDVAETRIVYRSGYAAQAAELKARLGLDARLEEARTARVGTDVRLVLGVDLRGQLEAMMRAARDRATLRTPA